MIETEEQRRWWFATHPEYSSSHKGRKGRSDREKNEDAINPRHVDEYVDNALEHETDESVRALLKSVKRNFGTEGNPTEDTESGRSLGNALWSQPPKEPEATIGPPRPPDLSDRARYVLQVLCPDLIKVYDKWRTGYYDAYPWAPGPLYDALPDLLSSVRSGLMRIQAALAKAVSPAAIAALQNARQELLRVWHWANFPRGWGLEDHLGRNLPRTFKGIDRFKDGVATSIKSMHLRSKSYQDPARILSKGRKYVDQLADFSGARMSTIHIRAEHITERVLRVAVPPGATKAQKAALKSLIEYGRQNGVKVEVIRVP